MQRDMRGRQGDLVMEPAAAGGLRPAAVRTAMVAAGCVGLAFTGSVWGFLPGQRQIDPIIPQDDVVTRTDAGIDPLAEMTEGPDEDALGFGLSDMLLVHASAGDSDAATDGTDGTRQLEAMITAALQQGRSAVYIDALVNEAVRSHQVSIPGQFVTAEGRADTATLLSLLSGQRPAPREGGTEAGYYIVQPGDSLAAIAYRHYGQTGLYREIFRANSDRLPASDRLRVGLRLVMPAL